MRLQHQTAVARGFVIGSLLMCLSRPVVAEEPVDWTAILLMSAEYLDMQTKLSWTGASSRVHVIVLHDHDESGMNAYRMLPDTNSDHPPGNCCPVDTSCCG